MGARVHSSRNWWSRRALHANERCLGENLFLLAPSRSPLSPLTASHSPPACHSSELLHGRLSETCGGAVAASVQPEMWASVETRGSLKSEVQERVNPVMWLDAAVAGCEGN